MKAASCPRQGGARCNRQVRELGGICGISWKERGGSCHLVGAGMETRAGEKWSAEKPRACKRGGSYKKKIGVLYALKTCKFVCVERLISPGA